MTLLTRLPSAVDNIQAVPDNAWEPPSFLGDIHGLDGIQDYGHVK